MSDLQFFGVRHHGPGCARSLVRALEGWRPDCILIEGPPEADALVAFATAQGMEPPVALLLYAPEEPKRATFYPFAEFSPEWQAVLYGVTNAMPVRFMDLPQIHQLALAKEEEGKEKTKNGENGAEPDLRRDPLGWLGEAAGYGGGEEWWEHMVERRQDGAELFAAIGEAMTAVRAETPPVADQQEERREMLREAHMRKVIRATRKEGFARIAVICGAWHVPALTEMPAAGADSDLLKNLPRLKVEATWVPWTYDRLAAESGYGAGVSSPAWYEHLWRHGGQADSVAWFARVARLLREADIDCSSAHVIECVRLSEALASVRERPLPGLTEMLEAARTVLTTGEEAPLRLIRRDLIIGRKLGRVAEGVPTVPLQRDLEKQQKSLRLKVSASQEILELDLRKDSDLARSRLLHRLLLLRIPWGNVSETRGGKGTFREGWKLQWMPEFALSVIEAAPYGNTIESAAAEFCIKSAHEAAALPVLTELITRLLCADLPLALAPVMRELENRVAVTGDIPQLMAAVPSLAKVSRYGDVRQTDTSQVIHILNGLVLRITIGLNAACQSLDDDAAGDIAGRIWALQTAIELASQPEHLARWLPCLAKLADTSGVHARVRGVAARILLDARHGAPEETSTRMSFALSRGVAPESAAGWLEGFLSGSGMVLVHDEVLFRIVHEWVAGLSADHFTQILPLVRRTFSTFPAMERRQIGERISRDRIGESSSGLAETQPANWDQERADQLVPVLRQILNFKSKVEA
ncbi:DUF5682 family protein [soil metagenome]